MRGRKPEKFELKAKDKAILQKLLRDGQTPLRVARRAQINSSGSVPWARKSSEMPPPSGGSANAIFRMV